MNVFKLEEYLARYEFSAKYLLCCSDAESFAMSDILNFSNSEDKKQWDHLKLGYTEASGMPALRQAVVNTFYSGLDEKNILMFAGAEEGIFCTFHALVEKGDHVIVLTPCYQSLLEIPKLKGAQVSEIQLREEDEWKINLNAIQQAIQHNTKIVIINFPHNPTGQVIDNDDLLKLVDLCDKNGIWLFSDEVYRLLGNPRQPWASPAACVYDKAISLGVMSKAFGMAGLRIGWIACQNKEILQKIECVKHYTSICNSGPSEILALISLHNYEKILARNNAIVSNNLKILDDFFNEFSHLFQWIRPQGGCVGFVNYNSKQCVDDFCHQMLQEKSTLLMPASIYNYESNHFRIGFGRQNMPEALLNLREFVQSS